MGRDGGRDPPPYAKDIVEVKPWAAIVEVVSGSGSEGIACQVC